MNDLKLTEDQEKDIARYYNQNPDLSFITKKVFEDDSLDGRSKQGRAVRQFLIVKGLDYSTIQATPNVDEVILTENHKEYIREAAKDEDATAYKIAKVLFPEAEIKSVLSKEARAVLDYLRKVDPSLVPVSDSAVGIDYEPPKTLHAVTEKTRRATHLDIQYDKLTVQRKKSLEALLRFLNSPRLLQTINSYKSQQDRELLESEFIRFTYDKPDLTMDEITLYINVCVDIVNTKYLLKEIQSLRRRFEEKSQDEDDFAIRLTEMIKAKSEEYDKVEKRIESLIKKLNGDRAARLKARGERSANFLSIVVAFQEEEERKKMAILYRAQQERVRNETSRLETMDEWKARILGISKEEAI